MRRLWSLMAMSGLLGACGQGEQAAAPPQPEATETVVARTPDAGHGRALFVDKGCVICHSVNGVGGKAAPALDAEIGVTAVDPLGFAARMWRGAPAMIELQSIELGYTIYLEAGDIADIAAFAASREEQEKLKLDDLPETMRNGLLDERFWEQENWDDFLKAGQELGYQDGTPPEEE